MKGEREGGREGVKEGERGGREGVKDGERGEGEGGRAKGKGREAAAWWRADKWRRQEACGSFS